MTRAGVGVEVGGEVGDGGKLERGEREGGTARGQSNIISKNIRTRKEKKRAILGNFINI